MKKTKILCTIGPASMSTDVLRKMYLEGMNGIRINTAFGNFKQYKQIINNIRAIANIPILLDLKGPEIRVKLARSICLQTGDAIKVGTRSFMEFNYDIYDQLNKGNKVLINDGKVSMHVIEGNRSHLKLVVDRGGWVEHGLGVNIPGKNLIVPSLSKKDLEAINFARKNDVSYIALSFVRKKEDLINLKRFVNDLQAKIIAKIENQQGVENFEEILEEADGIMIARGDLGVEIELERIPIIQKQIIQRCNQKGNLAITATEMLESMIDNPTPTRAEVSDVANAVLDGTDTLMLSGETAIGKNPVETVSMMTKIAKRVESSTRTKVIEEGFQNISSTVSRSIWQIAETMPLDKVITMTRTGYTAKVITRFKIQQPIIAVTASKIVKKQLELHYGIHPILFDYDKEEDRVLAVAKMLYSKGIIKEEENVLFTAGIRTSKTHASNLIEIHTLKELFEFGKSK